ncbi:hypothetical protein GC167_04820 [bacterium]|nr:hypothetical protein [bacterium]
MNGKNRLQRLVSWVCAFGFPVALVAFRQPDSEQVPRLERSTLKVELRGDMRFLTEDEVKSIVKRGASKDKTINIKLLEEQLELHNGVHGAEVFSSLGKVLYIRIDQRFPLLRLFENGNSRYLDAEGQSIQPTPHFSARVPVLYGDLRPQSERTAESDLRLAQVFGYIAADSVLSPLIDGGKWVDGELWLFSTFGGELRLGTPDEYKRKLNKYKRFYLSYPNADTQQHLTRLDLRFQGQIVARTTTNP